MAQALGVTLPMKIERNGYFGTNYDLIKQIKSNLKNLILTKKGERPMQPNFGCDIWTYVFEPHTKVTIEEAYNTLIEDVARWMPFLEIYSFDLQNTNESIDSNTITMKVYWRLRTNANIGDTLVLTF